MLQGDLSSLALYAGIHNKRFGFHRFGKTNLTVSLPCIEVGGACVLHHDEREKTNEYAWVSGIIGDPRTARNITIGKLELEARTKAQQTIREYMLRSENIELAKKQAEMVLRTLLVEPGCEQDIEFVWNKNRSSSSR